MGSQHNYQKLVNKVSLEDLFKIDEKTFMDPITRKLYCSDLKPMKTFTIPGISNILLITMDVDGKLTFQCEEQVKKYGSKLYIESISN